MIATLARHGSWGWTKRAMGAAESRGAGAAQAAVAQSAAWRPAWRGADLAALALADDVCDLWRIDLERVAAEGGGDPSRSPLDAAERARAARFVFERHRRWYTAARTVLRRVLGAYLGLAPEAVRIALEPLGRPYVELVDGSRAAIDFNLSHSDALALLAVARRGPLGADVELPRPMDDALALAQRNFVGDEIECVAAAEGAARAAAFFTCWTRKEAVLKSTGVGLSVAPCTVYVGATAQVRELRFASSVRADAGAGPGPGAAAGAVVGAGPGERVDGVPLRLESFVVREDAIGACAVAPQVRFRGFHDWAETTRVATAGSGTG